MKDGPNITNIAPPRRHWGERRHHFAGALGGALMARYRQLGWAGRAKEPVADTVIAEAI